MDSRFRGNDKEKKEKERKRKKKKKNMGKMPTLQLCHSSKFFSRSFAIFVVSFSFAVSVLLFLLLLLITDN